MPQVTCLWDGTRPGSLAGFVDPSGNIQYQYDAQGCQ